MALRVIYILFEIPLFFDSPCRYQNIVQWSLYWTIPDQGKDGVVEAAVVEDLCAEEEVSELDEGAEDDEEHDEEADHVPGAPAEGAGQLRHGLDTTSLHITALDSMYARLMKLQEGSVNICFLFDFFTLFLLSGAWEEAL